MKKAYTKPTSEIININTEGILLGGSEIMSIQIPDTTSQDPTDIDSEFYFSEN